MKKKFICLFLVMLFVNCEAQESTVDLRKLYSVSGSVLVEKPNFLLSQKHEFHGLAFVYNEVQPIYLLGSEVEYVDPNIEHKIPNQATYVGWKSRYSIGLIKNHPNIEFTFIENNLSVESSDTVNVEVLTGPLNQFETLNHIKYSHLWSWMKWLAIALEWLLLMVYGFVGNWGWSIVVFSLIIRLILFPVGHLTAVSQRKVSHYQAKLEPTIKDIKQNYKGEVAHNKLMAAHKDLGVTPFFSLKPMMLNLIQFPILIAIFNMLGELEPLQNVSFLWIKDFSLPDILFPLPMTIPLMGETFNLLPFIMTVITIISTITFQNNIAPEAEVRRQKRNLYLMGIGFFILCYPFPSSMVFYWALANFWQFITQLILNKREQSI